MSGLDGLDDGQGLLAADSREPYVAHTSGDDRAIQPKDEVCDVLALRLRDGLHVVGCEGIVGARMVVDYGCDRINKHMLSLR